MKKETALKKVTNFAEKVNENFQSFAKTMILFLILWFISTILFLFIVLFFKLAAVELGMAIFLTIAGAAVFSMLLILFLAVIVDTILTKSEAKKSKK